MAPFGVFELFFEKGFFMRRYPLKFLISLEFDQKSCELYQAEQTGYQVKILREKSGQNFFSFFLVSSPFIFPTQFPPKFLYVGKL
jgi:hypothetical protein